MILLPYKIWRLPFDGIRPGPIESGPRTPSPMPERTYPPTDSEIEAELDCYGKTRPRAHQLNHRKLDSSANTSGERLLLDLELANAARMPRGYRRRSRVPRSGKSVLNT